MEFDSVVRKRKSVRRFKSKKVDWRKVLDAIDSANQGPFAGNHNHLKYLIVENTDAINSLAEFCEQNWIRQAGIAVVVCSDDTHLENTYGERGRIYSRQQAGAAIQTLMLKLTDLGINSCWVGAYSDELLKQKLGIPQHIQIEAVIPIGFEEGKVKKPEKKNLERTLYWEKWGTDKRPALFREDEEEYRPQ